MSWLDRDAPDPSGQQLRPSDDLSTWVLEQSGRVVAESDGVELSVARIDGEGSEPQLRFTLADGTAYFETAAGWSKQLDHTGRCPTPSVQRRNDQRRAHPCLTRRDATAALHVGRRANGYAMTGGA